MSAPCDHKSVAVLVQRDGNKLLLIERKKPPFGFAVPAGHVDDHGSFHDAAIAELFEETGLRATNMILVSSGKMSNPCRRKGGNWHDRRIYQAEADGDDEVKSFRWASPEDLDALARKTIFPLPERSTRIPGNNRPASSLSGLTGLPCSAFSLQPTCRDKPIEDHDANYPRNRRSHFQRASSQALGR